MVKIMILISNSTRSVPLTICELDSRKLLHEKHSLSWQSWPNSSWELHLLCGGCIEFAVSPDVIIYLGKWVRKHQ